MKGIILAIVLGLLLAVPAAALAVPDHPTGLERAVQVALEKVDKVRGKSAEAPGQVKKAEEGKLTGRARAAAAIQAAIDRGNGNGNAFGRGHAAAVHALGEGESPSSLAGANAARVHELIEAYKALSGAD